MSSSFGYLIPEKSFEVGHFKQAIISVFESRGIIDGYYEEAHQWFSAGENSHAIFTEKGDGLNPAFEYVEIHDTINNRIIPDCTEDVYGAGCSICKADLDNALSEVLNDLADTESETEEETDMALLDITCENCGSENKLSEIQFDGDVKLKKQFVCFVDIECDFDEIALEKISVLLGTGFSVLYGSF